MVVLNSSHNQESLKSILVAEDSCFYLVRSKNPYAAYQVLWCRATASILRGRCKVDILLPGIMNIPDVSHRHIIYINNLPLMPIVPLVLLKPQCWDDHRNSAKHWERAKESIDILDVKSILAVARQKGAQVDTVARSRLLPSFVLAAEARVQKFIVSCPDTKAQWAEFGLLSTQRSTHTESLSRLLEDMGGLKVCHYNHSCR